MTEWPTKNPLMKKYLNEVLENGVWWSREGKFVKEFQHEFSNYLSSEYALCCSSGTTALETALKALDIGFGDFVIVPSTTFIGTATSVLKVGALPIFADVELATSCISVKSIAALHRKYPNKVKAAIIVHFGGQSCDIDEIIQWSESNQIPVIEDCAQAIGTYYKDRHVGTFGEIGCFSFQNTKNLSAGEGGCITTNSRDLAIKVSKYIDYNFDSIDEDHSFKYVSNNYRLSEFQAAVLLASFRGGRQHDLYRITNYDYLNAILSDISDITVFKHNKEDVRIGCHFFMFRYRTSNTNQPLRSDLIEHLNKKGVPCFGGYDELPLNNFAFFKERHYLENDEFWRTISKQIEIEYPDSISCPNSELLAKEVIYIPQFVLLRARDEIDAIKELIVECIETISSYQS
ncbi:MAG: dTDP-4-amino-4,6-dideoxygalactose transaminase [Arenicella sp.]|jgi:dTDP-4-amino-4,6-dideoxygalactose transaminase